jgi:hypothetical protein
MEAVVTARGAAILFNVPYTHMVKVVHQLGLTGADSDQQGQGWRATPLAAAGAYPAGRGAAADGAEDADY